MKQLDREVKTQLLVANMAGFDAIKSSCSVDDLNIIIALLQLGQIKDKLENLMSRALKIILSNPRFSATAKASVHLLINEKLPLRLYAQYGFEESIPACCGKFPLEQCECSRSEHQDKVFFLKQVRAHESRKCHDTSGHYCVPLKSNDRFIGILNLYVEKSYKPNQYDESFLVALSEALSVIITRHSSEEALLLEQIQLRQKIKLHTEKLQHELNVRRQTEAELRKSYDSLSRASSEEHALGQLLNLSLQSMTVNEFLRQSIDMLKSAVPWIGILPKGGVFLSDENRDSLKLVASYGLSEAVKHSCNAVAFGHCLCGQAAEDAELQFSTICCEPDKGIPVNELIATGHYSIPIMLGDNVLGVLVVYLPAGYARKQSDEIFLKRVADVLSMGITRRRFEKEVEYLKCHDRLTGLINRQRLIADLEQVLIRNERSGEMGALLFIGLASIKKVNDSLGHLAGDRLLEEIAGRLKAMQPKTAVVARGGGNEFIVMLPNEGRNVESVTRNARLTAEKIRRAIASNYEIDGNVLDVESYIGISIFPATDIPAADMVQQAATAMQRAKEEGCHSPRYFHPAMQDMVDQRFNIEQTLRSALDGQRLQLHFQPQVDAGGKLVGAEALLRCPDNNGDMIRMDHCIEVAESTGLILPIGEWVLCEACSMLESWTRAGIASAIQHLCINFSPRQFYQQNFVSLVKSILSEYDFDPAQLVFEITEGFLIDSKQEAIAIMQELKAIGVGFAIDDFGTGYSSLSYLARLPLDILKIDRAFVTGVVNDTKQAVIVETLVAMASQLGFETIAEGVESGEELEFMLAKGCKCFQGYYYSPPKPADEFTQELHHAVNG